MRKRFLGLFLVCSAATWACTSILGDFTIGTSPVIEEAGTDTSVAGDASHDSSPSLDAPSLETEAEAEAGPSLPPGTLKWVKSFGGPGSEGTTGIAIDSQDNIIVTGAFYSPDLDFGCVQHATSNQSNGAQRDGFVVKFDSAGNCQWVVTVTGTGDESLGKVAAASDGTVYFSGSTSSATTYLGSTVKSVGVAGVYSGIFTRISSSGTVDWVRRWGGTGPASYSAGMGVSVSSSSGNVAFGGSFQKAAAETVFLPGSTGGITLASPKTTQTYGFAVVYTSAGEPLWGGTTHVWNDVGDMSVYDVALDANDDLVLSGTYSYPNGFQGSFYPSITGQVLPANSPGGEIVFFMKVTGTGSSKGAPVWARAWAGDNDQEPQQLAVDSTSNVGITFGVSAQTDFGGGNQLYNGGAEIGFARYQPGGSLIFGKDFGSPSDDFGVGIGFGPQNTYVSGGIGGAVNFGGGDLIDNGLRDIFVASFDGAGKYRWAKSYGSSQDDYGGALAVGASNVAVTGGFNARIDFEGKKIDPAGQSDILVMDFAP